MKISILNSFCLWALNAKLNYFQNSKKKKNLEMIITMFNDHLFLYKFVALFRQDKVVQAKQIKMKAFVPQ